MAKKKAPQVDFLTFSSVSDARAEVSKQDRNLGDELYKKNWQSKTIDAFEKSIGIQPAEKKKKLKYRNRIFTPEFEKESNLLDDLMNNPKFSIIKWVENWGQDGKFKIFVVFAEDLDYKTPEQITKEIADGK